MRIVAVCLAGVVTLFVTACQPAGGGRAGMTIEPGGDLAAVVDGCGKQVVDVSLLRVDPWVDLGRWEAASVSSAAIQLNLSHPGPGWKATQPLSRPTAGMWLEVSGRLVEADRTVPSGATYFHTEDLHGLEPGKVLVGGDYLGGSPVRVVSVAEFHDIACP
jgi:hypothetical protein